MILDLRLNSQLPSKAFDSLRHISYTKSDDFNSLVGRISEVQSKNLDWWVEKPSTRNTLQSPLFYRFCCLYLVNDLIQSGTNIEKVIVDSLALFSLIRKLKEKENFNFKIEGPDGESLNLQYYVRKSIKPFLKTWKRKRSQFRAAKKTKQLSSKPPKIGLTLIDQFVFPGFITKERYYNGLWDVLTLEQREKTFFVPTLVMIKEEEFEPAYRELRTSERNFLIKEDYLTFSDLLFSLNHLFRVWFIKPPPQEVKGIDFSPLIREELLSGGGYESALEGLLNYRFAKRLKERSFDLSLVIDWWEGQPQDKGWNLGFNTFYPEVLIKGYLGYAPRLMELQLYPSDSEINNHVAPSRIVTIGTMVKHEMKKINPKVDLEYGPSFRFKHLWNDQKITNSNNALFTILVALTIIIDESIGIIRKVAQSISDYNSKDVLYIIKPHPVNRIKSIKRSLGVNWPEGLMIAKGSVADNIRSSDLLITGMSTIGLESIVMGVPTIVVKNNIGLFYDPIPNSVPKELWKSSGSPEEISDAIKYYRNRTLEEVSKHKKLSAQIKKDYFEPVTKEGVYKFLEFEN